MIFLVWTLPSWSNDALPIGLAPLVVMLLVACKMAFGFRSELALSAAGLEVRTFGLGTRRVTVFPLAELEELALLQPEQGGLRGLQTEVFAGVLAARSDRASVRFGHGLSRAELESLRALLRARVVELHRRAAPAAALAWRTSAGPAGESRPFPELYQPVLPLLGLAVGATAGHLAGGRLGACLACPFAEHVLNVGGLLIATAALGFDRRRWQRFWGRPPGRPCSPLSFCWEPWGCSGRSSRPSGRPPASTRRPGWRGRSICGAPRGSLDAGRAGGRPADS